MYNNRLNKIGSFIVIVTTLLFLVSCKGGIKSTEQDQLAADSLNKELLASDIEEVLYPLPAPFEMTQMLNDIGATYTPKTLIRPIKLKNILLSKAKQSIWEFMQLILPMPQPMNNSRMFRLI